MAPPALISLNIPHPALLASEHFWPALVNFWPTFQQHFAKHGGYLSLTAAKLYYARADPLHTSIWICTFFTTLVYVAQLITGNCSQVDRLWTFLPVIYTIHLTVHGYVASLIDPPKLAGFFSSSKIVHSVSSEILPRLSIILLCQILWSARLTYHAIRRGFFSNWNEEDYRWPWLRERLPRWMWEILQLGFIAIAQNILLALTALPQYAILTSARYTLKKPERPATHLTVWDYALVGVLIVNLTLEMISDNQQWTFQNYKRGKDFKGRELPAAKQKALQNEADVKRGFVTRGLWSISRHPNFLFEQINWWIFWAYAVVTFAPAQGPVPWKAFLQSYIVWGPLLMNLLFLSSTAYTEHITASKYPEYKSYQKRVGMFLPIDTALRAVYYRFIASDSARQRVESEVWGDAPLAKSK